MYGFVWIFDNVYAIIIWDRQKFKMKYAYFMALIKAGINLNILECKFTSILFFSCLVLSINLNILECKCLIFWYCLQNTYLVLI